MRGKTVVIGGGVAGLSALWHLCRSGSGEAVLVEREPLCGSAASGRNAGIFRHVEQTDVSTHLALRTRALLPSLGGPRPLLRETGAVYLHDDPEVVAALCARAAATGVDARPGAVDREAAMLDGAAALIRGTRSRNLAFVPCDGVLDVHGVLEAIRKDAIANGGRILARTEVTEIEVERGGVAGVRLGDGSRLECARVVLAAGAWAGDLGAAAGAPLPLQPTRRHLAFLQAGQPPPPHAPILWHLGTDVYARPESGGFLTSPGDEQPWLAELAPPADRKVLLDLAVGLSAAMPGVVESLVRRLWACLRTFAPDRSPVVGADPRLRGLFWLAGLGGQGLSTGLAAGEVLAVVMAGESHPLADALAPARLLEVKPTAENAP